MDDCSSPLHPGSYFTFGESGEKRFGVTPSRHLPFIGFYQFQGSSWRSSVAAKGVLWYYVTIDSPEVSMRVLLATDGSEDADRAAAFLTSLPLTQDDEILVLHVISPVPVYDQKEAIFIDFKELKQDIATRIVDETVTILKPVTAKISATVREGLPDEAIVTAAAKTGADLIVMGARGIGRFRRLLMGSVTRSVAANTTKPLLVIKHHERKDPNNFRIVFATDGSDSCLASAQFLNSLPLPEHVELTVVHVVWSASADIPDRFVLEIDDRVKEELAMIRKSEFAQAENIVGQFERILSSRFQGVKAVIKTGNPAE